MAIKMRMRMRLTMRMRMTMRMTMIMTLSIIAIEVIRTVLFFHERYLNVKNTNKSI